MAKFLRTLVVAPGILREEALVRVGAAPERWALEWRRPPSPVCAPDDGGAITCPCDGFAYGEMGELELVRRRPARPDERLALTPVFRDGENPADGKLAVLQRWPMQESDYAALDTVDLGPAVRARPATRALVLGDYDHDGRATEFLEWRCGDHEAETQTEVRLSAGPSGIDGVRAEYDCSADGARGRLLSSERI